MAAARVHATGGEDAVSQEREALVGAIAAGLELGELVLEVLVLEVAGAVVETDELLPQREELVVVGEVADDAEEVAVGGGAVEAGGQGAGVHRGGEGGDAGAALAGGIGQAELLEGVVEELAGDRILALVAGLKLGVVLLCNERGIPMRWQVVPGKRADHICMGEMVEAIQDCLWVGTAPLVCDRAMGARLERGTAAALGAALPPRGAADRDREP